MNTRAGLGWLLMLLLLLSAVADKFGWKLLQVVPLWLLSLLLVVGGAFAIDGSLPPIKAAAGVGRAGCSLR